MNPRGKDCGGACTSDTLGVRQDPHRDYLALARGLACSASENNPMQNVFHSETRDASVAAIRHPHRPIAQGHRDRSCCTSLALTSACSRLLMTEVMALAESPDEVRDFVGVARERSDQRTHRRRKVSECPNTAKVILNHRYEAVQRFEIASFRTGAVDDVGVLHQGLLWLRAHAAFFRVSGTPKNRSDDL